MPIPFTKPENLLGRFAVVKPWPQVQAAEDENIARLQITARSMGLECIVMDPEGVRLDCPEKRVTGRDVDFVISLHFETPKAYDVFSFVALWNPLRFFKDYGYRHYSKNLLTHDDFLSCSSTWADHHVGRMIAEEPGRLGPHFTMYHSLSEPIFEPAAGHGKIFYAGINWDRLGKKKGRHQDLLLLLDKAGVLRIHGPRIFNNVNVWEGYKCYVGPVPFDGVSMIKAISEAGIALVFSSDAHKESELMSNRLFESLAAGVVIICDDNPFARRHFGDTLLYVDASDSLENVSRQIIAQHAWIGKHPQEAINMARAAQAIFKEKFTLDRSLAAIYSQFNERKRQIASRLEPRDPGQPVQALLLLPDYTQESLEHLLESVESQSYPALQSVLLVDAGDYARHGKQIDHRLSQHPRPIQTKSVVFYERRANGSRRRRLPIGRVLAPVIEALPQDALFTTLTPNERWFSTHLGSLVHALQSAPGSDFAFATSILRHVNKGQTAYDLLEEVNVKLNNRIPPGFGRFLLRRSSLTGEQLDLMNFLDMRALSPFLVRGKGTSTRRATTVVRIQEPFVTGELLDDLMEQSIVEDRFREIEPPANLLRIQAVLAHPGLVSSLQSAQQMTFQNVLLRLQAAEGADAHAPSTLRQLRQLLVYELFHHETALARVEDAAAHLPPNPMADVISEVLTSEKCDTLLAYWVGLHLEAMHRPGEAMRAFNRSLLNSQASFLPAQYIARAALKAANLALQLDQTLLAEKTLREIVLKLQPSSPQAHAMLEKIAGKTGSAPSPKPNPPAPVAAPARHDSTAPAQPAKTPLVSAIVSTYKSEKFMRGCLEDLEAQTIAGELEIIVIDSCSPQNERAIVEEFQKNFPNIVYIRSGERETLSGAWNRAIKAARGKYITTANTDDRHRRDALETLSRTLDGNPDITLAYADCLITQIENETFESTKATRKFQWLDFSAQDLLLKGCFCGPQPMWRREVHDEHGYFDAEFVSAGDYEFWLKIARTRKFLHVKELLGLYLESPASVEHSNPELGAWETREAQRRYGPEILPGYGIDNMPPRPPSTHVQSAPPQRVTSIVIPPCGLAGNLTAARDLLDKKQHRAAWEAAIAAINVRPFHPEAHLLLAKIALAAGAGDASRQCAQRARQLAPEWSPARKFLKGNLRGQMKPKWLTAPPATPPAPRLSVCLIVKNEEQFLGQCLQSVRGIARQIVVLDTGSTDRTVAIAKEHGAEVFHFAWSDDFSAARNEALKYATGDWVLCLDADEELLPEHQRTILEEMGSPGVMGYRLPIINEGQEQEGCSYVPRLFRNAPGLFFVGRVHEQVFSSLVVRAKEWGLENRLGRAALLHHGYRKEVADSRGKAARNLRLLQLAIKELPGEPNLVMNLGLELVRSGQLEAGLEQYREALRLMSALPSGQVVPELRETLLTQLTTHLLRAGRFGEIVELWRQPFPQSSALTASQHFMLGLAQMELKQPAAAAEQMRQCLAKRRQPALSPINKEILKAGPHHCLALSLAALGQQAEAEQAFRDALGEDAKLRPVRFDFAKFQFQQGRPLEALKLANELVAESCQDVQTWLLGGQIALSQPDFLEFAQDWTGEAMKHFPEDSAILLQRAEALTLNQQAALALPLWTKAHSPDSARHLAALTLCELLAGECRRRFAPPTEPMVSQEFLKWYRRLIKFKARSVVNNINEKLDDLQAVLPGVVKVLGAAMKQAEATMAV